MTKLPTFRNILLALLILLPGVNAHAEEQTPWQTDGSGWTMYNLNWPSYNTGYEYTVERDGHITKLGGLFNGSKLVRLYNASGTVVAQTYVSAQNNWSYAALTAPVAVSAGETYTVAVATGWGGSTVNYGWGFPQLPLYSGDIAINKTVYGFGNGKPVWELYGQMWGQPDIAYERLPNAIEVEGEFPPAYLSIPAAFAPPYDVRSAEVYLNITNNTDQPETYTFSDSNVFNIIIFDRGLNMIKQLNDGISMPIYHQRTVMPGETWRVGGSIELTDANGIPLNPGEYLFYIGLSTVDGRWQSPHDMKPITVDWQY